MSEFYSLMLTWPNDWTRVRMARLDKDKIVPLYWLIFGLLSLMPILAVLAYTGSLIFAGAAIVLEFVLIYVSVGLWSNEKPKSVAYQIGGFVGLMWTIIFGFVVSIVLVFSFFGFLDLIRLSFTR